MNCNCTNCVHINMVRRTPQGGCIFSTNCICVEGSEKTTQVQLDEAMKWYQNKVSYINSK
jgi:hypothetical protein